MNVSNAPSKRSVAVVTGANSGLGYHVAETLASQGMEVLLACRDLDKARQARDAIAGHYPQARLRVEHLDLADLASVQRFAETLLSQLERIDLLINNAGVMALPLRRTADGFEMQVGTNHLGHFALTGRLLPLLASAPSARVITVSSLAHRFGSLDLDDLNWERRRYNKWTAYAQSKLANLMFALTLERRLRGMGSKVTSVAAHPGYSATHLQLAGPEMAASSMGTALWRSINQVFATSAAFGAAPVLHAAMQPVGGSSYFGPSRLGELRGPPGPAHIARRARDVDKAEALWRLSERLTGVSVASDTQAS